MTAQGKPPSNRDTGAEKTEHVSGAAPTPTSRKESPGFNGEAATKREDANPVFVPPSRTKNDHAASSDNSSVVLPKSIGGYDILQELGRGGMGVVYKAVDQRLKRTVALKMVWGGSSASPDELVRFRGEAEMVAQLQHPNIVQIHEIGMHEGQPFIVFEYVDGGNLSDHIKGKPQAPRQAAEMAQTLARAMHAAHQLHIIHRDLKPANVLLTKGGTVKITDFGLAKQMGHSLGLSRTGDVMGTPSYMAPEQAAGQLHKVGPTTDVYSLGAILYELLTGRPPFRGVTMFETLEQVRSSDPVPLSKLAPKLHRDICTICLKCLEKDQEKRYATSAELADDLRRWLDGDPILARPISTREKFWRQIKRHPWQAASALISGLMLIAMVMLGVMYRERDHQETIRQQQESYSKELQAKGAELQKQYDLTLHSMDRILGLVKEGGPLSKQGELDPLYAQLLAFYQKLIEQQEGNKYANLRQLAEACFNLGELIARGGNTEEAIQAYAKARALYLRLVPNEPSPEELLLYRHRIAVTHLKTGRLQLNQGSVKEAKKDYATARTQLQELNQRAPTNFAVAQDLAEAWHAQGELLTYNERMYKAGLEHFREARRIREKLHTLIATGDLAAARACQRDLARSFGYEGDAHLDSLHYRDADAAYWASHRLREALAQADPKDAESLFQLARSFGNFGNYQLRIRSPQTALYFYLQACNLQEDLCAENRAVLEYQSDLLGSHNRVIDLQLNAMENAEGYERKPLEQALRAQIDKVESMLTGLDEGWSANLIGSANRQPNGIAKEPSSDREQVGDPSQVAPLPLRILQRNLVETHLLLAHFYTGRNSDRAVRHRMRAAKHLAILQPTWLFSSNEDKPSDPYIAYLSAMYYTQRWAPEAKRDRPETDDKYAERAVQSLRDALQLQYRRKHPADLGQDCLFQALHARKEFQELIGEYTRKQAEAEAKAQEGN